MPEVPERRQNAWWAVAGPVPLPEPSGWLTVPHDRTRVLDRTYFIGPMSVRPGGKRLVEYLALEPLALEGTTCFESWPILVEGPGDETQMPRTPASQAELLEGQRRWMASERQIARDVRALCALLALAWNEAWQVRTAPTQASRLPPSVPDSRPPPPDWFDDGEDLPPHPEPLPPWVAAAWPRIEQESILLAALLSWHEGLLLAPSHPSFAHVAFVGAIEALSHSASFAPAVPSPDPPCSACGRSMSDSSQRFWAMAGQVATPEQVADLRQWEVLHKRGATAHGGGLHGIEEIYGAVLLLDFVPPLQGGNSGRFRFNPSDRIATFTVKVVPAVRDVARHLLMIALGAEARHITRAASATGAES